MMNEDVLIESLVQATRLVLDAVEGKVSIREFVNEYGDFYYYNALDGHESGESESALLRKYAGLCRLHEEVQNEVVDIVCLGDERDRQQFLAAGRIDEAEARSRLCLMAQKYRLAEGLDRLAERKPHPAPQP